jgi:trimeric autotransporter adhesin
VVRALLVTIIATGCVRGGGSYRCGADTECTINGAAGVCESTGFCSFPDFECESGYRYGEHAGSFANACADPATSTAVTIGGTVTNLVGSNLVLRNNGGDDMLVTMNGPFTFGDTVMTGVPYEVTVAAQPSNPSQTCAVVNGTGTADRADITDVEINCDTTTYSIGGIVIGLTGTGLVLTNNDGDDKPITANGMFTFTTEVASGAMFDVAVKNQPSSGTCRVAGGMGTVGSADITSVVINCGSDFTIGGTVSGLEGTVVLRNNNTENVTVAANGSFAFPTPLATAATYSVVVQTQPAYPPRTQSCVVTAGTGTVMTTDIMSVSVTCTTTTFSVGGNVTGLTGSLTIKNGTDMLTLTAPGMYMFGIQVPSGNTYNVEVVTQPAGQTCSVVSSTGTVTSAAVTNVNISCTAAGADPGILCNGTYCDPAAGELCCLKNGVAACATTCTGSGTPYRCDTQADCTAAGAPTLVCCGATGTNIVFNSFCSGVSQCTTPDAYFCDPNIAVPCPNGGTCTATSLPFPGWYRCF